MADPEHLDRLRQGVDAWNEWRKSTPYTLPELSEANLNAADLRGANLMEADLRAADLRGANLTGGADLSRANLMQADLRDTDLSGAAINRANLIKADLRVADLRGANFSGADLRSAKLRGANLTRANLIEADLREADLSNAYLGRTGLGNLDLSSVIGLDTITHSGPSTIGIDTVFASKGKIPEVFLRGCGVPDIFIQYARSLTNQPIQYYSCFISYSTKDQDFAERLHNDLQAKGVRCWFAPHDMRAGKKIHEQIDEAIRVYDKLLLILSGSSMDSEWVNTEIAKARKREVAQNRKMLFPVRLVQFETLQDWECFDGDRGKDSAREIREYYIPDFSRWKTNADEYVRELEKLLRDLKQDT